MTSTFISLVSQPTPVWGIGCETYYRVTGQIAGCTDISTEKARELWLEKYRICIELGLTSSISAYQSQLKPNLARWDAANSDNDLELDDISLSDLDTSSLALSGTTTYTENRDFCPNYSN
ncbi:MAG: hypothetical protein AAFQ41_03280 [Cyanobacteria bacterium J06623_7]